VTVISLFVNAAAGSGTVYAKILSDTRKEEEDERKKAEAYKNTAEMLVEDIQGVNQRIADTIQKIEEINTAIMEIDGKIKEAEQEIAETEDRIREQRSVTGEAIAVMYETTGSDDMLSIILRANDEFDILNRDEYIDSFGKYINGRIGSLQGMMDIQEEQYIALKHLRMDKEDELIIYEDLSKELSAEMEELSALVVEAEKKAGDAEKLAEELAEQVAILEAKEREVLGSRRFLGENSNVIYDGDGTQFYYKNAYPYTAEDVKILAAIIQAEAGGTSYPGMIAVGSVIMNRVEDSRFPNTLEGVIYEPYQFEPVQIGSFAVILAEGPVSACYQAAEEVLQGKRNVPNIYFKAAWYAEENGIQGVNIGGNVFH
jgi:Cell wall hydrolyses involved in spore germination